VLEKLLEVKANGDLEISAVGATLGLKSSVSVDLKPPSKIGISFVYRS